MDKLDIWQTTKGSDAGEIFVTCPEDKVNISKARHFSYLFLLDGKKYRWPQKPKQKNICHCQWIGELILFPEEEFTWDGIENQQNQYCVNAKIRRILKRAKGEFNV